MQVRPWSSRSTAAPRLRGANPIQKRRRSVQPRHVNVQRHAGSLEDIGDGGKLSEPYGELRDTFNEFQQSMQAGGFRR